ncbi:MAG: hypothetical protein IJ125_03350 [Atopobiaceae bacterium]|nr:hypothetical protein [Atopobiaceae bacterium]
MKIKKSMALLAVVPVLALAIAGCGGTQTAQQSSSDGSTGSTGSTPVVEQVSKASDSALHFDATNKEATVEVTVNEGEGLFILSKFEDDAEDEIPAVVSQNGEEKYTDYLYSGSGYSETDVDPGTYSVRIDAGGATGTAWVLAYPVEMIDFSVMDADQVIEHIVGDAA